MRQKFNYRWSPIKSIQYPIGWISACEMPSKASCFSARAKVQYGDDDDEIKRIHKIDQVFMLEPLCPPLYLSALPRACLLCLCQTKSAKYHPDSTSESRIIFPNE